MYSDERRDTKRHKQKHRKQSNKRDHLQFFPYEIPIELAREDEEARLSVHKEEDGDSD